MRVGTADLIPKVRCFSYILKVFFPLPRNTALHFNLQLAVRREPILIRKDVKSGITTAIIRTEEGGGMNE